MPKVGGRPCGENVKGMCHIRSVILPRIRSLLFSSILCLVAAGACTHDTTGPSSTQPFSVVDLTPGTGDVAANNLNLTVDYTGWLFDPSKADNKGLVFDTTVGQTPFTFTLGVGDVIKGWDTGLVGMKVGGVRRLVVPPSLGYGSVRQNSIPPYSTLLFEITLENVVNPNAPATTSQSGKTSHR
jgi:FKBP-type peptidyl-prolyl cis-trans isomerase FkpA